MSSSPAAGLEIRHDRIPSKGYDEKSAQVNERLNFRNLECVGNWMSDCLDTGENYD